MHGWRSLPVCRDPEERRNRDQHRTHMAPYYSILSPPELHPPTWDKLPMPHGNSTPPHTSAQAGRGLVQVLRLEHELSWLGAGGGSPAPVEVVAVHHLAGGLLALAQPAVPHAQAVVHACAQQLGPAGGGEVGRVDHPGVGQAAHLKALRGVCGAWGHAAGCHGRMARVHVKGFHGSHRVVKGFDRLHGVVEGQPGCARLLGLCSCAGCWRGMGRFGAWGRMLDLRVGTDGVWKDRTVLKLHVGGPSKNVACSLPEVSLRSWLESSQLAGQAHASGCSSSCSQLLPEVTLWTDSSLQKEVYAACA